MCTVGVPLVTGLGNNALVYAGGRSSTTVELKPLTLRPETLSLDINESFTTIVVSLSVTGHESTFKL